MKIIILLYACMLFLNYAKSINPPPRRNPLHGPPRPGQSPRRGFYENEVLHAYHDGTVRRPEGRAQGSPVLQPNSGPPQAVPDAVFERINHGHNDSNALPESLEDVIGSYISVKLRGDRVLTGFLRGPPTGNRVQNRIYVRFPFSTPLHADLKPVDDNNNNNNYENYPNNRCFLQILPDFFLSATLETNQVIGPMNVLLIHQNTNMNTNGPAIPHYGVLNYYSGNVPTLARYIRH